MKPLRTLLKWWRGHGTRILGIGQGTIAVLSGITGLFPDDILKYVLAVSAVLTYWRGQVNSTSNAPPPAGG